MKATAAVAVVVTAIFALGACGPSRAPYQMRPIPGGQVMTPGAEIVAEDGSFRLVAGQRFAAPFNQGDDCLLDPNSDNYREALGAGAQPVVIRLGNGRQLYGLLSLCGAPAGATGPATRSYALQIPNSYVAATAGGAVSVVYEPFQSSPIRAKAWILWLSETSFRNEPPMTGQSTVGQRVDKVLGPFETMRTVGKWTTIGSAVLTLIFVSRVAGGNAELFPDMPIGVIGITGLIVGPIFWAAPGADAEVKKLALDGLPRERNIAQDAAPSPRALIFTLSGRF